MEKFDKIQDTLFVPMLGRIYASEKFPLILKDEKALELRSKLPKKIKGENTQTQYTLIAGAVRSANMDKYITEFISKHKNGIVVQLGCGLETSYNRTKTNNYWYEVDFEEVINYRKTLIGETKNDICVSCSALSEDWIKKIRERFSNEPILVTASGLFYYFKENEVYSLIKMLKKYGNIELVFDIVNFQGMKRISKYMKQVGHEDANMYFYVDDINKISKELNVDVIKEEPYYKNCNKKGLNLGTKIIMKLSDLFMMVKMIHLKINR